MSQDTGWPTETVGQVREYKEGLIRVAQAIPGGDVVLELTRRTGAPVKILLSRSEAITIGRLLEQYGTTTTVYRRAVNG